MSYENSYSLKLKNAELEKDIKFCSECNINIPTSIPKYCSVCGTELTDSKLSFDGTNQILSELREFSDEAKHLLKKNGGSDCTGSGHSIEKDILNFSKNYPKTLFELNARWDNAFGDPPSRFYIMDGKIQNAKVTVVFEDFDETKLV